MLKRIVLNLEVLEGMLYFWQATKDKEKVGEAYIMSIAGKDAMKEVYDSEFGMESVRVVLSAISNRELLNSTNKKERRFWNNNMWMLEDMTLMQQMIAPLKKLNLDNVAKEINESKADFPDEEIEIVFFPGHMDANKIENNKLYLNFFLVKPDLFNEEVVLFEDKEVKDYIKNLILSMN